MKLSGPQVSLLKELAEKPRYVSDTYPPLVRLRGAGLVEVREGRFSSTTHVTDAGRQALTLVEQSTP
jgi:hypothetical protein